MGVVLSLARGGVVDGPEGVLITVGSQEALYLAHLALVDPGQEVLHVAACRCL